MKIRIADLAALFIATTGAAVAQDHQMTVHKEPKLRLLFGLGHAVRLFLSPVAAKPQLSYVLRAGGV